MAGIDIKRFINSFGQNYARQTFTAQSTYNAQNSQATPTQANINSTGNNIAQNIIQSEINQTLSQNLQLNTMQNIDRALYAKDVLQLPRNLNEFIYMLQRGLTPAQLNKLFAQNILQRSSMSQIQAQILAQMQGTPKTTIKEATNLQLVSQLQGPLRNLEILSGGLIKLDNISLMLQQNGKEAITKLIMTMTEASKAGITDLAQMKEMAKLINASVAVASENNPQKTLKLLILLYLPWLPLEEGVEFDLEIDYKNKETKDPSDCILTITVVTINYGLVKGTLMLETSNSVHVDIEANKEFPQKELELRINGEQKHYSIDSNISFNTNENIKQIKIEKQTANINLSQTTEINPYLLLMAHTLIKNIIEIDNNKTIGITSHEDSS